MDPIKNPFSPGAGAPPPELVGREGVLDQSRILFGRVRENRPEKSLLLTGLRGVGKTVLLNEMDRIAAASGFRTILVEAHEDKPLPILLAPHLRRLLFDLDRLAGAGHHVRRGLSVLKSFIGSVKVSVAEISVGLDIEPERGTADSGDLEVDLPDLFTVVAEAAAERGTAVSIGIDEVQYFSTKELSALIMAMHRLQQRQLPLVLIGAGLPILPALAGESKSYAERLFSFPDIGPLSPPDAAQALQDPALAANARFTEDALARIAQFAQGYPYFIQEWGYQAWNLSSGPTIDLDVIERASETVIRRLDENFFRVRFDRLTPSERRFLRAMAELGGGPQRSGDVVALLATKPGSLGPTRAKLIKKGMIYSPSYGDIAFTVPLFDEFMRRAIPTFDATT